MILVGLGANLPTAAGPPLATLRAVLDEMPRVGVDVLTVSPWYESAPVPASDQPWYCNGVAIVSTMLTPPGLLARLHLLEAQFGRTRSLRNSARTLDLDLLAYNDKVMDSSLQLPHPRLHERAFVLTPLCAIAPNWRHPVLGLTAKALLDALPPGQQLRPLAGP